MNQLTDNCSWSSYCTVGAEQRKSRGFAKPKIRLRENSWVKGNVLLIFLPPSRCLEGAGWRMRMEGKDKT